MCTVSVIYDYGRNRTIPWNPIVLQEFNRLIEQAEKFDEVAGEPDCEDPEKSEWHKRITKQVEDAFGTAIA